MKAEKLLSIGPLALVSFLALISAFWLIRGAEGLPLDDAYIFRRYAENLSLGYGFSFNPGETSFGCTSFLWPVILSFFLRVIDISHYAELAQSIGSILFGASVFLCGMIILRAKAHPLFAVAGALITAFSPTMFMNTVSGMETSLFVFEVMLIAWMLMRPEPSMIWAGLLAGLIFLTRPEGLYFALAVPFALLLQIWRAPFPSESRAKTKALLKFAIPFLGLALPYLVFLWSGTGSLLPTTYRGKIMAADPGLLDRPVFENLIHAVLSLGDGWRRLLEPVGRFVGLALLLFAAYMGLRVIIQLARKRESGIPPASLIVLSGFLFLPAAYGYGFRVHPAFGGYYHRYIAAVFPCFAILGCLGMETFYNMIAEKIAFLSRNKTVIFAIGFILFLIYSGPVYYNHYPAAREVYINEVSLNEGIRKEAALWVRDHTQADARVLVGYTGLGVVGSLCERYVLDMGALINPDIFSYYENTMPMGEKRWQRIIEYIRDREINYYVTFFGPEPAPDPGQTPGFREKVRIGDQAESPSLPYSQIRIYEIKILKEGT
jgi:hypothetical protein